MHPGPFLQIPCLPDIKFPTIIALQQVYHIATVTVEIPSILPMKFIPPPKGEGSTTDNITHPVHFTGPRTKGHFFSPSRFGWFQGKFRTDQQIPQGTGLSRTHDDRGITKNPSQFRGLEVFSNVFDDTALVAMFAVVCRSEDNNI